MEETMQLTKEEYKSTMTSRMRDVTDTAEPALNIWSYVEKLKNNNLVLEYVYDKQLVEKVYRNDEKTIDHVLLPTKNENIFMVIVIDLIQVRIKGHFELDLDKEYGIS
jgi:hypothetical protein